LALQPRRNEHDRRPDQLQNNAQTECRAVTTADVVRQAQQRRTIVAWPTIDVSPTTSPNDCAANSRCTISVGKVMTLPTDRPNTTLPMYSAAG
jgi:hypothetical protein